LTEPVAAWSRALSRAAAAKLLAHTSRVWLALDEPALGLDVDDEERATAATILHAAMDDLRDSGVRAGLHCCSPPPFDRLDRIRPDWLSFDLVRFGVDAREHAGGLSDFLSAGGELLLGVLPPLPRDDDPDPLTLIDDFVAALRGQGADADSLARLSLSPSCGTLLAPKSRERQVAARLAELARHLEERIAQP
ncbi:MAG: hypothetical protein KDB53_14840, partial [Planctomycetes bacterium]|nr:hypothetical protein [Planctomycetota bacterium]